MRKSAFAGLAVAVSIALTSCGSPSVGSYFAPTAAVVNGDKIAEAKVSQEMRQALSDPQAAQDLKGPGAPQKRLELQRQILTRLIKQQLVFQQAPALKVSVKPAEIETEIRKLDDQYKGRKNLEKEASKQGFTIAEIKQFLRERILIERVIEKISSDAKPKDAELKEFYEQNKATFDDQVRAAHILVCTSRNQADGSCAHSPEDEQRAKDLVARARNGEDFGALAKEFSTDDSNKEQGGDLGYFTRGQMVPEFEQAAFSVPPGQVSDPVKTRFGFHVIKVLAKGKTFEEAKAELVQSLGEQRGQQAFQDWLNDQLNDAKIVINPRFGRFDKKAQLIVPRKSEVDSSVPGGGAGGDRSGNQP